MTGAPGLMTLPPWESGSELIPEWHPGDPLPGLDHNETIDVTGGIKLKLKAAARMCQRSSSNIWIVDGRFPQRIVNAVENTKTAKGTRISAPDHKNLT